MRLRSFLGATLVATALLFTGCAAKDQSMVATEAKKEVLTAPTPAVQALIDKYQLENVDFAYVKKAIGDGTRKGATALMVDARPNKMYLKGTIPSSLSLPDTEIDKYIGQFDKVPKDKEIIAFCGGWHCKKSPIVAGYLKGKGFTNVKLYQAGEPEWVKKSYDEVGIPIVQSAIKKDTAILMDARPRLKYLAETIPGAMFMLDTELDRLEGRFPADKTTPIIAFCGGYNCHKSHVVANRLLELGYTDVRVFAGGLPAWKKAGLQTTAGGKKMADDEAPKGPVFVDGVKTGVDEGTVDGDWLLAQIKGGTLPENVKLVDVRSVEEYAGGFIPGAVNIPAEKVPAKELAAKMPEGKVAIFYCGSGARAMEAYFNLKDANMSVDKVMYFDANIGCSKENDCEIEVNEPLG